MPEDTHTVRLAGGCTHNVVTDVWILDVHVALV